MDDDVEDALIGKYNDNKWRSGYDRDDHEVKQLKRQALFDGMMNNDRYLTSVAEQKRIWRGSNGLFKRDLLSGWFRIYNQTSIKK